jgi:drug/metabolite transporter (DMT)-like permease
MQYLVLCTVMSVAIFLSFRSFSQFRINTFQAIVVNYVVCVITGLAFIGEWDILSVIDVGASWFPYAILLGILFIFTFYLMALTAQKISVTVSSVANKMSLVIPVAFSLFVFDVELKQFDWVNYSGIILAIAAIYLSSIRKKSELKMVEGLPKGILFLPVIVFLMGGIIDTLFNYVSYLHLPEGQEAVFSVLIFLSAGIIGILTLFIRNRQLEFKSFIGGLYLGIPNYFSIYFLVRALESFQNDGAFVFPVLNIGIILFSSFFSILLYREKLTWLNQLGLFIAIIALVFLSYQEILNYLGGL